MGYTRLQCLFAIMGFVGLALCICSRIRPGIQLSGLWYGLKVLLAESRGFKAWSHARLSWVRTGVVVIDSN